MFAKVMIPALEDLLIGWRFYRSLPAFLARPVGSNEAEAELRERLANRERDFLSLARRAIYGQPENPFHRLLAAAGCEFEDLGRLVTNDGVESALRTLQRQGVYLTVEELKGRKPVVRGATTIAVQPGMLENPRSARNLPGGTGGGRGHILDLGWVREMVIDSVVGYAAEGAFGFVTAFWVAPSAGGLVTLTGALASGITPVRWFSPADPKEIDARYRVSTAAFSLAARLGGIAVPRPVHVPIDRPLPIARWMTSVLRSGRTPALGTYPAAAIRLCQAAMEEGIDLTGARMSLRGEPLTEARLATLERAGIRCTSLYGSTECGLIGVGCLARRAPDEVHLCEDLYAMIQVDERGGAGTLPPGALLMSSIRPTAPFVLLNVSIGDSAICEVGPCGCPLERAGWKRRLHTIRSFEKLTAAGMTFADGEVIRVIEETLPSRFGGTPADYQLVEQESDDGRARLAIVIHPSVGELDEAAVVTVFLESIARFSETHRMMAAVWKDAKLVHVVRSAALATSGGKIHHLRGASRA